VILNNLQNRGRERYRYRPGASLRKSTGRDAENGDRFPQACRKAAHAGKRREGKEEKKKGAAL
jgi:hypothetical protein